MDSKCWIFNLICAKQIICLKKLLEDYLSPWKVILDKFMLPIGGRFVLNCNFQTSKLKINLPAFYKECFDAWSEVKGKTPSSYEEIVNESIWNNKFLCHDKKSMYIIDTENLGLVKITDVISANNSFSCDFSSFTNPEQRFFLISIINSIPAEWCSLIKASANIISANPLPITPTIKLPSDNVVQSLISLLNRSIESFCSKSKLRPPQNRNYQTRTQI